MGTSVNESIYQKGGQNEEKSYKYASVYSADGNPFSRMR